MEAFFGRGEIPGFGHHDCNCKDNGETEGRTEN